MRYRFPSTLLGVSDEIQIPNYFSERGAEETARERARERERERESSQCCH